MGNRKGTGHVFEPEPYMCERFKAVGYLYSRYAGSNSTVTAQSPAGNTIYFSFEDIFLWYIFRWAAEEKAFLFKVHKKKNLK